MYTSLLLHPFTSFAAEKSVLSRGFYATYNTMLFANCPGENCLVILMWNGYTYEKRIIIFGWNMQGGRTRHDEVLKVIKWVLRYKWNIVGSLM